MAELSDIRPGGTYEPPKHKPLGGAQWQQQALFTAKPSDEHRYPRGYTPERLHAVEDAFPPVETAGYLDDDSGFGGYWGKHRSEMVPRRMQGAQLTKFGAGILASDNANTIARNRMVDVYARSTAPSGPLRSLQGISVGPPGKEGGPSAGALGSYYSASKDIRLSSNDNTIESESTLIHEVGHHADYEADPYSFQSKAADYYGASPKLEGYAVGFEAAHHVQRPGNTYNRLAYEQFHNDGHFQMQFHRASGKTVVDELRERGLASPAERPRLVGNWDPRAPYQQRLYGRNVETFETSTEKDYGQWDLENYSVDPDPRSGIGPKLDTIRTGSGVPKLEDRLQEGVDPIAYKAAAKWREEDRAGRRKYNDDFFINMARNGPLETTRIMQQQQFRPGFKQPHPGWPK